METDSSLKHMKIFQVLYFGKIQYELKGNYGNRYQKAEFWLV